MNDGNVNEFLNSIQYQDTTVEFHGHIYFFNPGFNKKEKYYDLRIEEYDGNENFIRDVFYEKYRTPEDRFNAFLKSPIWDGRTFWEVEQEMTWGDL